MKFASRSKRYLAERKEVSEKYGPRELFSVTDQWPLYCGEANLARFLAISDLVREVMDVPGHIAEFGCWKGANTLFMAKLLRIYDPNGPKVIHAFDSFEGLTAFSEVDGKSKTRVGDYKGSLEELEDMIRLHEMQDEVLIHKGLIEKTLSGVLESDPALSFSLVYCDTDLFESTRVILERMHPRLVKGGLIVFDQWNYENFPGEGVAANAFLADFGDRYQVEAVPFAKQPSMVIRKISY